MKKAFTLIEMLIAITILSLMMVFLYQSYSSLNISNKFYKNEAKTIKDQLLKKRTFFLDLNLALENNIYILHQDPQTDIVFTQSSNSLHRRYNPYLAYIVQDSKLYRLESLTPFLTFPISSDREFNVDYLGDVNSFRLYKSTKKGEKAYLLHVDFKEEKKILLKIGRG
jgi:prepilin-type N-terminal cleavage/methylation domain-containing protein